MLNQQPIRISNAKIKLLLQGDHNMESIEAITLKPHTQSPPYRAAHFGMFV